MQIVVAGLIWQAGRLLIAQRRASDPHPLKWEFPGGKVEIGETPEQAVIRELNEELGIHVTAAREFARYEYTYPGKPPILLIFFEVRQFEGAIGSPNLFESLRWETPDLLPDYDFLDGDLTLIQLLRKFNIDQVQ